MDSAADGKKSWDVKWRLWKQDITKDFLFKKMKVRCVQEQEWKDALIFRNSLQIVYLMLHYLYRGRLHLSYTYFI